MIPYVQYLSVLPDPLGIRNRRNMTANNGVLCIVVQIFSQDIGVFNTKFVIIG